jgi:hypothetical protein
MTQDELSVVMFGFHEAEPSCRNVIGQKQYGRMSVDRGGAQPIYGGSPQLLLAAFLPPRCGAEPVRLGVL